ncbi:MAG: hypothetical protein ACLPPF_03325 [Rhodomicrobium sp.]
MPHREAALAAVAIQGNNPLDCFASHAMTATISIGDFMRLLHIVSFVQCGFAGMTVLAQAGECPAAGREAKFELIASAPSCQEAARLFKLCAVGASFDGELALRVDRVCEKSFLSGLPGKEREAYEAAIDSCNAPYAKKRGSIYRSVAARCRVDVMLQFAKGH